MNNHMSLKLVGANSSLELNSPITSIYLQEELTGLTTLPGIRETKGMNIGMNGGWTSAQFYEPRLITIKGVIANQDVAVVEQRRKQLIQLLAEKRLALEFQTEAGNHYTMDVVVAGVQMPLSKVLTASYFQLNLRADDPLIYDNNALAELEAILRRSSSASSGFTINFPINFQLGVSESRPTIDNFGSSVVYPVITLTGPLTTPEVVNITTNMAFTIDEVLSAGAYTLSGIRGVMTQEGTVDAASGSAFQITGIEGAPLTLTEITGNATQNGTPTPDAPVAVNTTTGENVIKITGKNLFDKNTAPIINVLIGANTLLNAGAARTTYIPVISGQTYTFSRQNVTNQASDCAYCFTSELPVAGLPTMGRVVYNNNLSFTATAPNNAKYLVIYFAWGRTAEEVAGILGTYQLELGAQATAYEPYQGQGYEVNLGKNLLENTRITTPTTTNDVTATPNSDGSISLSGTASALTWFVINNTMSVPAGTYTLSGGMGTGSGVAMYNDGWGGTEIAKTVTLTSKSTGNWSIRIASGTNTNGMVVKPQLEKGSQATSYAPYFTPIELAKIGTYQDRIYKEDSKWYIEKQTGKVVLDGTEGWSLGNSNDTTQLFLTPAITSDALSVLAISTDYLLNDRFNIYNCYGSSNTNEGLCYHTDRKIQIRLNKSRLTTVDAATFKTWLASNPTTVYYALATPTTTEITDSTLLAQLNFIANLYGGTNNIILVGTGAQGEIEVRTGQIIGVIDSLSIVGTSGSIDINLNGSELAAVGSVTDELAINGTTGAVTKTARIGKIASYAGETITTDYISTTGGLDTGATVYYVLPSSSTSTLSTLDSTALASFNGIVASGGVSAQTNIGSISVDVTTLSAQDVAVVDTKQHTVTINGVGAYSKFSGDWLTLDVGLNELQLITENNADTGSAVIKYRVGYMGV